MPGYFDGKVALVTGASSGIGKQVALHLVRAGARVAILARNRNALEDLAHQMGEGQTLVCPADVTDPETIKSVASIVLSRFGKIDILVNAAGILRAGGFLQLSEPEFRQVMEVDYFGTVNCLRAVLPHMVKARAGHVVNVSSLAGKVVFPGSSAYSAAKFAIIGMSNALRQELKPYGIGLTVVCPGYVDTPLLDQHLPSVRSSIFFKMTRSYAADKVAIAILNGIKRNKRELILPGSLRLVLAIQCVSPTLAETLSNLFNGGVPELVHPKGKNDS
ncbi:MAG: SDR family NAD(P)-dependent oxidoreductase [Chloroflexi bacterium]|nr:SDR family NAD(P)-dependent oxidoreductase [Chloroflexota bacterium]